MSAPDRSSSSRQEHVSDAFLPEKKLSPEAKELRAVAKLLRDGKNLKTKTAVGYYPNGNSKRVDFFRGDECVNFLVKNEAKIVAAAPTVTEGKVTRASAKTICNLLIKGEYFDRAERPVEPPRPGEAPGSRKLPKWPKKLVIVHERDQVFNEVGFCTWNWQGSQAMSHFLLALVILSTFAICLFPVWPLSVKIGLWYVSVVLLVIMSSITFVRLFAFIAFWLIGIDFWIMPNLFNDDVAFTSSFFPLFEFKRRKDTWSFFFVRFITFAVVVALIVYLAQPQNTDKVRAVRDQGYQSFLDLVEWGPARLAGSADDSVAARARRPGVFNDLMEAMTQAAEEEKREEELRRQEVEQSVGGEDL